MPAMVQPNLPAIHDAARLWDADERAILRECRRFLQNRAPGWTLSWLREAAHQILNDELTENALWRAVNENVPEESRASVRNGLNLLLRFARKLQLQGVEVAPRDVPVGRGFTIRIRLAGIFYSPVLGRRWAIAVQPRLDDAPTLEQSRIWLSALHYEFCCDPLQPLEAMIIDLSREEFSGKRCLKELTAKNCPLLDKSELDARLDLVASCWKQAIETTPIRARPRKGKDPNQKSML